MHDQKITREKQNKALLVDAEKRFGKNAPTESNCMWFTICCQIGTVNGCPECPNRKIFPTKPYLTIDDIPLYEDEE
jgi:hypothetical protein